MAQKTVVHKGYHGTIEVDNRDYSLYGKILFLDDDLLYKGQSFEELEKNFRKAVEDHILACQEKGEKPPFDE